jgi:hypothetical protein
MTPHGCCGHGSLVVGQGVVGAMATAWLLHGSCRAAATSSLPHLALGVQVGVVKG